MATNFSGEDLTLADIPRDEPVGHEAAGGSDATAAASPQLHTRKATVGPGETTPKRSSLEIVTGGRTLGAE